MRLTTILTYAALKTPHERLCWGVSVYIFARAHLLEKSYMLDVPNTWSGIIQIWKYITVFLRNVASKGLSKLAETYVLIFNPPELPFHFACLLFFTYMKSQVCLVTFVTLHVKRVYVKYTIIKFSVECFDDACSAHGVQIRAMELIWSSCMLQSCQDTPISSS